MIEFPNLFSLLFLSPQPQQSHSCHQPTTTRKPSNNHSQIIEAPSSSMSSTIVTYPNYVPPWKPRDVASLSRTTHETPLHFIPSLSTPSSDPTIIVPPRCFMADVVLSTPPRSFHQSFYHYHSSCQGHPSLAIVKTFIGGNDVGA